ncbi:serine hydrolase domain-containing protein [Sandarakinorhabdus oryzae]|uniref:serine hydrolase domain-containing protein n=1 Tax=Sandarakinorhabdus oryzae TaxID=2675220 RepID=UPI0012E11FB9|nr:serine hydrolase domain-containing protein [Sandarakinorhabdus oryzae]
MRDRIRHALETTLAAGNIPGAVAVVGNSAGTLAEVAVGSKGPGGPPLAQDDLFQIASMTKAIASVAAMQLVEQGRLSLDDDIGAVLPQLANPAVLEGFDEEGKPVTRPAAGPITLRQLLTHTSGFGYEFMSAELTQVRLHHPAMPGSLAALAMPLLADPGTRWIYGTSTDFVGLAVEAVSGMRLGDWLARHVTGPLGMSDTTFAFDAAVKARLTPLHVRTPDGGLMAFPIHFGGGEAAEYHGAGGGLVGTARDYLHFARMILNRGQLNGARILRPDTVTEMASNQVTMPAGRLTTNQPGFSSEFDLFPTMDCGFGLGFLINPEPGPDGRAAGSLAWAGIANSYYWIDPENDIAAVICMQHLPFGEPAALDVLRAFERAVYGR